LFRAQIVIWKFVGNWDNRYFNIEESRFDALPFTFFGIISMHYKLAFLHFIVDARGNGNDSLTECLI
jgi:hypothetical protein